MTTDELMEIFEENNDEFLEFGKVENKRSNRADLHAFILLDEICPSERGQDIVCSAEHDQIWLQVELEELAEKATKEQLIELIRCGVRCASEGLCMFV